MRKELIFRYVIAGINDMAIFDGLVPSLLELGVVPAYPLPNKVLPNQCARLQTIVDAQLEMRRVIAEQRITHSLCFKLPLALSHNIRTGDQGPVYRGKSHRWVGPYAVQRLEGKRAFVTDGFSTCPFNVAQLLPFMA